MLAKGKKISKSSLKKKCDTLASKYYRAETPYCELKDKDGVNCGGSLQWAHIFTRGIVHIRYQPYNKLVLCAGHHRYYTSKPIEWVRILEKEFPDRLKLAEENRYKYEKVDYDYWINHFAP
jgi:hypothetical protein